MNIVAQAIAAAAKQLEQDTGAGDMSKRILEFPTKIREQQKIVRVAKEVYDDAKGNLSQAEAAIVSDIAGTLDDKGKPKFSNAESRKAEFEKRGRTDPDYQAALQAFDIAEEKYSSAQFDLQLLQDEFAAHRTVGDILAGRLKMMA